MFISARKIVEMSREEAAGRLSIGTRTLNNYEHGYTIVPPDTALRMQEVYGDPTLTARYCAEYCPIGQIFAHSVPDQQNLCSAVLGLLKEHNDVMKLRESLIEISADGVIDQYELPAFQNILDELIDLEKKIEEVKMHAATMISIPEMMQKRKRPLAAAR